MRADRIRWNARYGAETELSFNPHPLAVALLGEGPPLPARSVPGAEGPAKPAPTGRAATGPLPVLGVPAGPVLELACGPSGSVLLAAAAGRHVVAVDISDVALGLLAAQIRRRGLTSLINLVHADLDIWSPEPASYALVLCTGFWARDVFAAAARAVAAGGLVAWEALTAEARLARPSLPPEWCLRPGEPASLLPPGFTVIVQRDVASGQKRQLIARSPAH